MGRRLPRASSATAPPSPSKLGSWLACPPESAQDSSSSLSLPLPPSSSSSSPPSSSRSLSSSLSTSASHSGVARPPPRVQRFLTGLPAPPPLLSSNKKREPEWLTSPPSSSVSSSSSFGVCLTTAATRPACAAPRESIDQEQEEKEDEEDESQAHAGVTLLAAAAAAEFSGQREKKRKKEGWQWVRPLLHNALLYAVLLAISLALFHVLLYFSVLPRLLPLASSSDAAVQQLLSSEYAAVVDSFHQVLAGLPLPKTAGINSIEASAVVVGPTGTVRAPYSRVVDHLLKLVTLPLLTGEPRYVTGDDFSIIIPVRNEEEYLPKTLKFLFEATPPETIREVIVVDDNSDTPIEGVIRAAGLPHKYLRKISFIRFHSNEGLIRARVAGAAVAQSENLFFLDGHCRPKDGWAAPLLRHLKTNYRRIACPRISDIYPTTWEDVGTHGYKMMFEWTFEFGWYYDADEDTPILSGGILAITKKWWKESGEYDLGMLEWGGENLEQSLRVWMCGGEIFAVPESAVGHIFNRKPKPNPGNRLVIQVQKNQRRAAKVWLDEYYFLFYKYHVEARHLDEKSLRARQQLRYERLTCVPFEWFAERFRTAFERKNLLDHRYLHIQHEATGWCLSSRKLPHSEHEHLVVEPCIRNKKTQLWTLAAGQRMIANKEQKCIDAYLSQAAGIRAPIAYPCDWQQTLNGSNPNQLWQWDIDDPYQSTSSVSSSTKSSSNNSSSSNSSSSGDTRNSGDSRVSGDSSSSRSDSSRRRTDSSSGSAAIGTARSGRIFLYMHADAVSIAGNDVLPVAHAHAMAAGARCLCVQQEEEDESDSELQERQPAAQQAHRGRGGGETHASGWRREEERADGGRGGPHSSSNSSGYAHLRAAGAGGRKPPVDDEETDEDLLFVGSEEQLLGGFRQQLNAAAAADASKPAAAAEAHSAGNARSSGGADSLWPLTGLLDGGRDTGSNSSSRALQQQHKQQRGVLRHTDAESEEAAAPAAAAQELPANDSNSSSRAAAAQGRYREGEGAAAATLRMPEQETSSSRAGAAASSSSARPAAGTAEGEEAAAEEEGRAVARKSGVSSSGVHMVSTAAGQTRAGDIRAAAGSRGRKAALPSEASTGSRRMHASAAAAVHTPPNAEPSPPAGTTHRATEEELFAEQRAPPHTFHRSKEEEEMQEQEHHFVEPSSAAVAPPAGVAAKRIPHALHSSSTSSSDTDTHRYTKHATRCLSSLTDDTDTAPAATLLDFRLVTWRFCDELTADDAAAAATASYGVPHPSWAAARGRSAAAVEFWESAAAAPARTASRRGKIHSGPDACMRFRPLWVLPPLSSRFGRRTLEDAAKINDATARSYLAVYPDVEV